MTRFRMVAAVLCAASVFGLAAVALGRADEAKEKPKNAPTLDDAKATVTEPVDGQEKTRKLDLKYALKVKGYFTKDGFHLEEVEPNGPASHLDDGNGNAAMMEKGDIITEIDGKPVKTPQEYAKAMNGAADHSKTKVKVKDVRTGNEVEFTADAEKR
jgi:S1-C subfamily serine protease